MGKVSPYAKAIVGFIVGAVTTYLGATDGGVTSSEWLTVLVAGLVGSGLVYAVPNKDPRARHQDESVQPPQGGYMDVTLALLIAILIGVVLLLFRVHFGGN